MACQPRSVDDGKDHSHSAAARNFFFLQIPPVMEKSLSTSRSQGS